MHLVQKLYDDGSLEELHKETKILVQAPFAVHSPLVEPLYPCYLKAASMEWAWLADITLPCHRAEEGGGDGEPAGWLRGVADTRQAAAAFQRLIVL